MPSWSEAIAPSPHPVDLGQRWNLPERPQPGDPSYQSSRWPQPRLHLGPRDSLADGAPGCAEAPPRAGSRTAFPEPLMRHESGKLSEAADGAERRKVCLAATLTTRCLFCLAAASGRKSLTACASWLALPEAHHDASISGTAPARQTLPTQVALTPGSIVSLSCSRCSRSLALKTSVSSPMRRKKPHPTESATSDGFCLFPGDHSERGGVRRIHFENAYGNLVLRVPRDPSHPTLWAVPPEGYTVSFAILGGQQAYVQAAQTSQRDASSGLLAQSLKAAVTALDGSGSPIDELPHRLGQRSARSGAATHWLWHRSYLPRGKLPPRRCPAARTLGQRLHSTPCPPKPLAPLGTLNPPAGSLTVPLGKLLALHRRGTRD